MPGRTVRRVIVLTPMMGGADGVSEMTRQWVRVLESRVGRDVGTLEVWSLDDTERPAGTAAATVFHTARGGRIRFASLAVRDGLAPATDTLVVVMHLHLLPVALPLIWRGAQLLPILMGIEAWTALRPLERAALGRAWKVVAISTHTAVRFRAANPSFAAMPVAVCRPGTPPATEPAAERFAGPYALIVGRMSARERYKGHDMLIDAWPLVREAVPAARLVVAGDGDDAPRLRAKAGEGIDFAGRVDEPRLAALYRDATLFVMPSTDEGFGLVYLEAMRAATPCIAARGAAEEIITDGRDGVIVDAGDRDALVAALVQLFSDPQARARMAAAAVQRVSGEFGEAALDARVRCALELGEG
ncbi:MAG TPA: glycosyltransferase family 4 protein [Vicinamibacterales bacterium]|jgi:phosphatidylinositol alpha-1,6-mannosyltransferase|nr:glycosyltransferase family 4 protein [Vicinamibacterales bacterium]